MMTTEPDERPGLTDAFGTYASRVERWYERRRTLTQLLLNIAAALLIRELGVFVLPYVEKAASEVAEYIAEMLVIELTLGTLLVLMFFMVYITMLMSVITLIVVWGIARNMDGQTATDGGVPRANPFMSRWFWIINVAMFTVLGWFLGATINDTAAVVGAAMGFTLGQESTRWFRALSRGEFPERRRFI